MRCEIHCWLFNIHWYIKIKTDGVAKFSFMNTLPFITFYCSVLLRNKENIKI